jgi:beta-glucosidase
LAGFIRCEVDPGEARRASLSIPLDRLAERDVDAHAMVVRPGGYELRVARHAADPGITLEVEITRSA